MMMSAVNHAVGFHFMFLCKIYWPPEASMLLQTSWRLRTQHTRFVVCDCNNIQLHTSTLHPSLAKSLVFVETEPVGIELRGCLQ